MEYIVNLMTKLVIYSIIILMVRVVFKEVVMKGYSVKSLDEIIINKLQLSKLFMAMAIIYSVLLIVISSIPNNIMNNNRTIFAFEIIITFNILLYYLAIYYRTWEIRLNTEGICRKKLWRKKIYKFSDVIRYSLDKNGNIEICFSDGKRIIIEDILYVSEITSLLKRNHVQFQTSVIPEIYVVEENIFYRIFSGLCVVVGCVLLILCVSARNFWGIIMFGVLLIASVFDFGNKLCNKIIASKNEIRICQFLRKDKIVPLSKLKYVKRKIVDNLENVWVYSEDELLFKYRKSWNNAEMIEPIVRKLKQKQ